MAIPNTYTQWPNDILFIYSHKQYSYQQAQQNRSYDFLLKKNQLHLCLKKKHFIRLQSSTIIEFLRVCIVDLHNQNQQLTDYTSFCSPQLLHVKSCSAFDSSHWRLSKFVLFTNETRRGINYQHAQSVHYFVVCGFERRKFHNISVMQR